MAVLLSPLIEVESSLESSLPRAVAAPASPKPPTHRLRVRGDGRCAVRATLCAAPTAALKAAGVAAPSTVGDVREDASEAAREYLRDVRIAAASSLVRRMSEDSELDCVVRFSFPEERYDTFDEWLDAQRSDDAHSLQSHLWHGGGQWTLYGLALLLGLKIVVHVVESDSLEMSGPASGTDLVDARPGGVGPVVRLASMRADDGTYDHFDVLLDAESAPLPPHAQPLGRAARRIAHAANDGGAAARLTGLLGWAALNVLAVAMVLSMPPAAEGGSVWLRVADAAQYAAAQAAQLLALTPETGVWPAVPPLGAAAPMELPLSTMNVDVAIVAPVH